MTERHYVTEIEVVKIVTRIVERLSQMPGHSHLTDDLLIACDDELDSRGKE